LWLVVSVTMFTNDRNEKLSIIFTAELNVKYTSHHISILPTVTCYMKVQVTSVLKHQTYLALIFANL